MRQVHQLENETLSQLVTLRLERDQFASALKSGQWRVLAAQARQSNPTVLQYLEKEAVRATAQSYVGSYLPSHPEVQEAQREMMVFSNS